MNLKNLFPLFKNNSKLIYFDNSATTPKPGFISEKINNYLTNYSTNSHRGDYPLEVEVDTIYEKAKNDLAKFLNCDKNELIFTSGSTHSSNQAAFSFKNLINENDKILMSNHEHSSTMLPWFRLCKEKKAKITYFDLGDSDEIILENILNKLTSSTKVLVISHITNVYGIKMPVEQISDLCRKNKIKLVIDGAQAVSHIKIDLNKIKCDAYYFSFHKAYGPTGLGVLYLSTELIKNSEPLLLGGGMNENILENGHFTYKKFADKFEAGTQNLMSIFCVSELLKFLNEFVYRNHDKEIELANYCKQQLKKIPNVVLYNENVNSNIVTFNINPHFCQDVAHFLGSKNICVRSGEHCAKLLKHQNEKYVIRASFAFYNETEEIDKMIDLLKNTTDFISSAIT